MVSHIISIIVLSLVVLYFGFVNHRDREHYTATISDMNNKLMAQSLTEYATNKSRIERKPDDAVSSEERLEQVKILGEDADIHDVD